MSRKRDHERMSETDSVQRQEAVSDLMTFAEAAAFLGLDRMGYDAPAEAVRYLCRTRRLRHVKVGKRILIRRAWLLEYLERESVPPLTEAALTSPAFLGSVSCGPVRRRPDPRTDLHTVKTEAIAGNAR
jgi:excisionase family DNA binding protein